MRKFLFGLLMMSLAACRQESDEASASVIDGVWESDCITAADQSGQRIRYSFFANNTVQRVAEFYSDAGCTLSRGTLSHVGIFDLAVQTDSSLYEIDLFFREAVGIPADQDGATAWNEQKFCELDRWLPLVDEDVIAQNDPNCGVYGVSRIEYRDLLQLDPGTKLVFGGHLNHVVPRPSTIAGEEPSRVFRFLNP